MEHILIQGERDIRYNQYLDYLETIRDRLPGHVYDFASSAKHFTLDSPHSLHDSWLESLTVTEHRQSASVISIKLCLLGQQHDRKIILEYKGVTKYMLEGKGPYSTNTFHGDVYTHEVRSTLEKTIIHEILFESGSVISINCRDFCHHEEMLDSRKNS